MALNPLLRNLRKTSGLPSAYSRKAERLQRSASDLLAAENGSLHRALQFWPPKTEAQGRALVSAAEILENLVEEAADVLNALRTIEEFRSRLAMLERYSASFPEAWRQLTTEVDMAARITSAFSFPQLNTIGDTLSFLEQAFAAEERHAVEFSASLSHYPTSGENPGDGDTPEARVASGRSILRAQEKNLTLTARSKISDASASQVRWLKGNAAPLKRASKKIEKIADARTRIKSLADEGSKSRTRRGK